MTPINGLLSPQDLAAFGQMHATTRSSVGPSASSASIEGLQQAAQAPKPKKKAKSQVGESEEPSSMEHPQTHFANQRRIY